MPSGTINLTQFALAENSQFLSQNKLSTAIIFQGLLQSPTAVTGTGRDRIPSGLRALLLRPSVQSSE